MRRSALDAIVDSWPALMSQQLPLAVLVTAATGIVLVVDRRHLIEL